MFNRLLFHVIIPVVLLNINSQLAFLYMLSNSDVIVPVPCACPVISMIGCALTNIDNVVIIISVINISITHAISCVLVI